MPMKENFWEEGKLFSFGDNGSKFWAIIKGFVHSDYGNKIQFTIFSQEEWRPAGDFQSYYNDGSSYKVGQTYSSSKLWLSSKMLDGSPDYEEQT